MRKLTTCLLGACLSLGLVTAGHAQVLFSHLEIVNPPIAQSISGNSQIVFQPGADALANADGGTDVVLANLEVFSTSATADAIIAPYSINMFLTDIASGVTENLTFTGELNGVVSTLQSNVGNTFFAPLSQQLHIGHHVYTVSLTSYVPPGPPGSQQLGSIGAHVSGVIPEPGTMALLGTGLLPLMGLVRRRRR
jgi:hypothetical protein